MPFPLPPCPDIGKGAGRTVPALPALFEYCLHRFCWRVQPAPVLFPGGINGLGGADVQPCRVASGLIVCIGTHTGGTEAGDNVSVPAWLSLFVLVPQPAITTANAA